MSNNVLITGTTGMIGSLVLQHCLESPEISKVTSLLRRKSGIAHEKLNEIIIEDFMNLDEGAPYFEEMKRAFCIGSMIIFRSICLWRVG